MKKLKFIIYTFLMIGPIAASYIDSSFSHDKGGCVNIMESLSSKVTSKLNNDIVIDTGSV
ncbi:hypothetical protein CKK02_18725 [Acinetobacter baumannii]|nr:hypothetical protein [Acinetobacter baumannii]